MSSNNNGILRARVVQLLSSRCYLLLLLNCSSYQTVCLLATASAWLLLLFDVKIRFVWVFAVTVTLTLIELELDNVLPSHLLLRSFTKPKTSIQQPLNNYWRTLSSLLLILILYSQLFLEKKYKTSNESPPAATAKNRAASRRKEIEILFNNIYIVLFRDSSMTLFSRSFSLWLHLCWIMMNGASSLLVCRTRAWTLLPSVTSARRQYNLQYITTSFHHHQQQQQHHPTTNHARNHILVRLRSSWTNDNDSNNNNDWTDEPRPRTTNNRGGRSDRSSRGNDNNYNRDQSPQRQTSSWDREDDWRRDNNEYRSSRSSRGGRGGDRGGGRGGRGRGGRGGRGGRRDTNRGSNNDQQWRRDGPREGNRFGGRPEDNAPKIDMKGLEAEGFVHLYGLAPVLSALKANRRDFSPQDQPQATTATSSGSDYFDDDDDDGNNENNNNDDDFNAFPSEYIPRVSQSTIKPEAQFTPWLFLQDRSGGGSSGRSGDKVEAATQVNQLAEERGIPVHYTDKGSLNALSGNRPHQVRAYIVPHSKYYSARFINEYNANEENFYPEGLTLVKLRMLRE